MPRRLRILVADDYRDSADSLGMLLRSDGYRVSVVSSGDDAIEAVGSFQPDVVILDLMMPRKDGFETVAELKQRASSVSRTYVAYTGVSSPDVIDKCTAAGFRYFLRKPASVQEIEDVLGAIASARDQGVIGHEGSRSSE